MPLRYLQSFRSWLDNRPALTCGLSALVGTTGAFYSPFFLLSFLLFPLILHWKKSLFLLFLSSTLFLWCRLEYPAPQIPFNGLEGIARVTIDRLSQTKKNGKQLYLYQGRIQSFWTDPSTAFREIKNCPYSFSLSQAHPGRPSADRQYLVRCTLKPDMRGKMTLAGAELSSWEAIPFTFSFAEWRFHAKSRVNRFIQSRFHSPPVQRFLSGILTGEFDDRELFEAFKDLGLIHLLAISGFHFSLIAALGRALLALLIPEKFLSTSLLVLLCSYFLFLGWGPSVLRAWISILIFYGASFFYRFSDSGNALGLALLLSLLIDPPLVMNIGFQFSFLTTAAILFINPLVLKGMEQFFPLHTLKYALKWSLFTKQAYLIFRFWLSQMSLGIATTAFTLPLSLVIFGSFPTLGLLYNLFYPSLVSVSISLLLLGLMATPIPVFADAIHLVNDYFTSLLLNMTKN